MGTSIQATEAAPTAAAEEGAVIDPAEVHRTKQRRLLFAIQLTLIALILILSGTVQGGWLLAVFALIVALSGL